MFKVYSLVDFSTEKKKKIKHPANQAQVSIRACVHWLQLSHLDLKGFLRVLTLAGFPASLDIFSCFKFLIFAYIWRKKKRPMEREHV